jgi:hypothetical protein
MKSRKPTSAEPTPHRLTSRIREIRRRIGDIELICAGTLLERTKVCGKPNCRCAHDPAAQHGPYYEWKRREQNQLRHRIVSAEEARQIRCAQDAYQLLLRLLANWEDESLAIILGRDRLTHRKHEK